MLNAPFRDTVDPIIEINCLDSKKYSTSKKAIGPTGIVHWGEHIFFEPKKLVSLFKFDWDARISQKLKKAD